MTRPVLHRGRSIAIVDQGVQAFRAALSVGDLAAPVPSCPDWSLRQLALHLGGVHRWARNALIENRPREDAELPADGRDALLSWFDQGAGSLRAALAGTDPAAQRWGFGPPPHHAAFWFRRQGHETWMHAWDAHSVIGQQLHYDPTLAWDGVDEVIEFFVPRQVRLDRIAPLTHRVAFEATDPILEGARVLLEPAAPNADVVVPSHPKPDAVVRGPAQALLLLLWRRIGPDDPSLHVVGDPSVVRSLGQLALTP